MTKLFDNKETKEEKIRWSIYHFVEGCLSIGCIVPTLFSLMAGLSFWIFFGGIYSGK